MKTQDLLTRISCLEGRLAELLKENARLHEENECLRHRVGELEEILKSQADSLLYELSNDWEQEYKYTNKILISPWPLGLK